MLCVAGAVDERDCTLAGAASQLAPDAYRGVTQERPHGSDLQLSRAERSRLSSEIFTNNIRVTLVTLAAGIAFGVGSALVLLFNGIVLGVVGGLAIGSGNGEIFLTLVAGHGMLELSCIVVAGAAGMRLGWSFVEPWLTITLEKLDVTARRARYVGRPATASTATGLMSKHLKELETFLDEAFAP